MVEQRMNRRDLLHIGVPATVSTTLVAVDSIAAHSQYEGAATQGFWEQLETGTLFDHPQRIKNEIEHRYRVRILPSDDPEKIARSLNISPSEVEERFTLRTYWDAPRLQILESTLAILPQHFYSPSIRNGEEKSLNFSLFERVGANISGQYYPKSHEIMLSRSSLRTTFPNQLRARQIIVHELTHAATLVPSSGPEGVTQESLVKLQASTGLTRIEDLRNAFSSIVKEYGEDSKEKDSKLKTWITHIGYGASNFNEFWAVASEFYFEGQEGFVKSYKEFLGSERATAFYEALKEEFFKGFEYREGRRIR